MKIRPGDIIITLVIAAIAVVLLLSALPGAADDLVAVIIINGEEAERIELSTDMQPEIVSLEDVGVIITAQNGEVAFTYSDCPDQTCVHTGWLSKAGDIAVCIPNEVIVKIEGITDNDIDVVAE